ncbi:hypothetical protein Smp_159640 [Schistosoma mansoni]|uniref:hypothetical protein n=1 Tax=Schistosoma mansoni TaxID=6183 RepID=UPI0001A61F53|nr:hypothetical protein Smp_159640 [Schistosoma mansoni]|eukprot:XP_018646731.1 hypothetical protein Smp_159640 [Schistosoma mansoni]
MPKKYKKKEKPIYVNDIPGLMKPNNELHNNNGTIEYSLSYNIKEEQLKICIIQANNLIIPNDKQEPLNAYATISLMKYDNNTQLNNPSNILDPNLDPNLNDKHLKLIVEKWRYRRIVGEVCIGQDVFQLKSIKHWDELLKFPDKLHVRWHPIYAIPIKQNSFLLDWLCFDPL